MHPQKEICFRATNLDAIFTWVDASYAVHHDMKSQSGVVMSMGLGVTHCILCNQKLNMKISMEAILVGASYYVPYNILYVMLMHYQGILNKSNNFFQDKKSHMRMEVNGGDSFTGNMRYIDIRYFLLRIRCTSNN